MAPAAIVDEVKKSNLRGRGGAGFPTGHEVALHPQGRQDRSTWSSTPTSPSPAPARTASSWRYDPHLLIEGMLIASYALGCKHAYIYIRGEMIREAKVVQRAVDEAYAAGYLGKAHSTAGAARLQARRHRAPRRRRLHLRRGDRAAQLARGQARLAAPQAAVPGGQGPVRRSRPSSTTSRRIMNIPDIIDKGGEWFAKLGIAQVGRHAHPLRVGPRQQARRLRAADGHPAPRAHLRRLRRHPRRAQAQGRSSRAAARCRRSTPASSTSRCEFDALMTDARIKDVEVKPGVPFDMGGGKQAQDHGRLGRRRRIRREHRRGRASARASCASTRTSRAASARPAARAPAGWRASARAWRRARARRATSTCCANDRRTASPATPSARSATRRPGRCSASSPSSAPSSRPSCSRQPAKPRWRHRAAPVAHPERHGVPRCRRADGAQVARDADAAPPTRRRWSSSGSSPR